MHTRRLDSLYSTRQQQDEIRTLHRFTKKIGVNSNNSGHTGGATIQPELLNHVSIPYNWKEFIFHRGSAYNQVSITKSGLVAGGKESKKKECKLFSSHLLFHSEVMHMKKDRVKINQNQEMFIIIAIAETIKTPCTGKNHHEHKIMDCNTKSNALDVHQSVTDQYIKTVGDNRGRILFQRTLTPRPGS